MCRHHASRGLAVLLRHGLGGCCPPVKLEPRAVLLSKGNGDGGDIPGTAGSAGVIFDDEQSQPWKVVQTWLELRHDLAVVALLQVSVPETPVTDEVYWGIHTMNRL